MALDLEFDGRRISKSRVKRIWSKFKPSKPFPNVEVYVLSNTEFKRVYIVCNYYLEKAGVDVESGQRWEYGKVNTEPPEAFFFASSDRDKSSLIFINAVSHYSVTTNLKHELRHIYDDDVAKIINYKKPSHL